MKCWLWLHSSTRINKGRCYSVPYIRSCEVECLDVTRITATNTFKYILSPKIIFVVFLPVINPVNLQVLADTAIKMLAQKYNKLAGKHILVIGGTSGTSPLPTSRK
jgi:hypothetical protein